MKPEQQRIKIAEACGWRKASPQQRYWNLADLLSEKVFIDDIFIPDYLNDLNAMHEAEKILTKQQWEDYGDYLERMIDPVKGWLHATAAQRAEAFLKTLGLWED